MKTNSPFKKFCVTIGNLPSSYVDSLSYYECLCWLFNYLNSTVITDINNISEATTELQEKFIELKDYVDNYFDNLDIQEEIDNKLDEMAESGQLADIIAQYLNSNCILAFDTIAAMAASENLVNGSFARTYGKLTYNDGLGNYYKIRAITSGDVIDGYNIVAITNDNTIIAERMPDNYIGNLTNLTTTNKSNVVSAINELVTTTGNLQEEIDSKLSKRRFILVGDSYAEGYGNPQDKGWGKYLIEYLNVNDIEAQEIYEGGTGFVHTGNSGHTILQLMQTLSVQHPETISDIVVIAGYNDKDSTEDVIKAAIGLFVDYCKETYINANISIGMAGNNADTTNAGMLIRHNLTNIVLPAYKACVEFGASYLNGIEYSTHFYNLFYSDNVHLTDYSYIAKTAYNILMGNGSNVFGKETDCTYTTTGLNNFVVKTSLTDNVVSLRFPLYRSSSVSFSFDHSVEILSGFKCPYMRHRYTEQIINLPVNIDVTYNGGTHTYTTANLQIAFHNGKIELVTNQSFPSVTNIDIYPAEVTFQTNNW